MEQAHEDEAATRSGGGVQLRLFGSLDVPAPVRRTLAGVGDAIASRTPGARHVVDADLHLTFAFVGAVAEEYVPAVAASFEDTARTIPGPVACTLTGTAPFGRGRVLGATVEVDLLAVLAAARERFIDAVRPYAHQVDERAWRPHVSLVRAPREGSLDMPGPHELQRIVGTSWLAASMSLRASLPGPGGSHYRLLHDVPFGQPALRD